MIWYDKIWNNIIKYEYEYIYIYICAYEHNMIWYVYVYIYIYTYTYRCNLIYWRLWSFVIGWESPSLDISHQSMVISVRGVRGWTSCQSGAIPWRHVVWLWQDDVYILKLDVYDMWLWHYTYNIYVYPYTY